MAEKQKPGPETGRSDVDFDRRLAAARKDAVRRGILEPTPEEREDMAPALPSSGFAAAYRMGIELVAGVIVGLILGLPLDSFFGTAPLFLIIFLLLGFAAGLLNVFRAMKRMNAGLHDDAKADTRPPETRE